MEAKERSLSKQFQYTGEKLRQYLQQNNITYKEAAKILDIDKNTVGKAVRGGNLNVDILLHICNVFQMDVTDFFCCEITEESGKAINYYISSEFIKDANDSVAEEDFNYKKSKNYDDIEHYANDMFQDVDHALISLDEAYSECREKLESLFKVTLQKKAETENM